MPPPAMRSRRAAIRHASCKPRNGMAVPMPAGWRPATPTAAPPSPATGDTDRGAAFARWVLEQDRQRQYLTDAVVRGEQVLGIKVQPGLSDDQLRELMEVLAERMAETFPGRRPLAIQVFDQA